MSDLFDELLRFSRHTDVRPEPGDLSVAVVHQLVDGAVQPIGIAPGLPIGHPGDDVTFEHFREDHVPQCEALDNQLDIFNTTDETAKEATLF